MHGETVKDIKTTLTRIIFEILDFINLAYDRVQ